MSRLDYILNHAQSPASTSSVEDQQRLPPSPSSSTEMTTVDSYYYAKPEIPEHKEHPHCPSSLHCLRDTDGRPPHTLPVILRCTILGSPKKKLTIREIYAAMETKYPWYKTAGPAWKQSVRHHLSLNLLFEREARPVTDPGVGSYWTVNLNAPPGTKRPRKRGKKDTLDDIDPPPPPRKRGRPRKYPEQEPMVFDQPPMTMMLVPASDGYPPGCQLPTWSTRTAAGNKMSEGANSSFGDDEDTMGYSDAIDGDSADDYESEEEPEQQQQSKFLLRPIQNGSAHEPRSRQFHQPSQSAHQHHQFLHPSRSADSSAPPTRPNYVGHEGRDNSDRTIERLRHEVEGLRQQSADAVSVSVKMSDQLAEAHAEASRARAELRALEGKYEEADKRRKDAERRAEEQAMLRFVAEEKLQDLKGWRRRPSRSPED